jgi:hypothetical protein
MPLEPPIIIVGDGQVEFYSSLPRLEGSVEACDAELYKAYDSKGRPIGLRGQYQEGKYFGGKLFGLGWVKNGPVTAEALSDEPSHVEELRLALLDWWVRTGGSSRVSAEAGASEWTLDAFVKKIADRDGIQ